MHARPWSPTSQMGHRPGALLQPRATCQQTKTSRIKRSGYELGYCAPLYERRNSANKLPPVTAAQRLFRSKGRGSHQLTAIRHANGLAAARLRARLLKAAEPRKVNSAIVGRQFNGAESVVTGVLDFNTSERRPHPLPTQRIGERCGELGVWWFGPRIHHQLVFGPVHTRRPPAWPHCPPEEVARASRPVLVLRQSRQGRQ